MSAKNLELLLIESVENLGIVGDVVKVRSGYARNYLYPRNLATKPDDALLKSLAVKRAEAERELAEQRKVREDTVNRLSGFELVMLRSCNDQKILYASVTQQEIADALLAAGYGVRPRDIRLPGAIKRIDSYDVQVKFAADLETRIKVKIQADRELEQEAKAEMDFDEEGNLIRPGQEGRRRGGGGRGRRGDDAAPEGAGAPKAEPTAPPKVQGWGKPATAEVKPEAGATAGGGEPAPQKAQKKSKKA